MSDTSIEKKKYPITRRNFLGGASLALILSGIKPEVSKAPGPDLLSALLSDPIEPMTVDRIDDSLYEIAGKYNLTLAPQDAVANTLHSIKRAITVGEAANTMSQFTEEQFGFPFTVESSQNILLKNRIAETLNYLSILPRELFEAISLTVMTIGTPPMASPENGYYAGSFTTNGTKRTLTIDPSAAGSPGYLFHELAHGLDYATYLADEVYDENERRAMADQYLNHGFDAEYIAEQITDWMLGGSGAGVIDIKPILERFDSAVPNLVAYVNEAVRPLFTPNNQ